MHTLAKDVHKRNATHFPFAWARRRPKAVVAGLFVFDALYDTQGYRRPKLVQLWTQGQSRSSNRRVLCGTLVQLLNGRSFSGSESEVQIHVIGYSMRRSSQKLRKSFCLQYIQSMINPAHQESFWRQMPLRLPLISSSVGKGDLKT